MNRTSIEWCRTYQPDGSFVEGHTVNPVRFVPHGSSRAVTMCQKVSAGCKHCYAETITRRFWPNDGLVRIDELGQKWPSKEFPGYTALGVSAEVGEFVLDQAKLLAVLKHRPIKKKCVYCDMQGHPCDGSHSCTGATYLGCKIFWGDMTDLFGPWVKDEWLDQIFAVCSLTPHITHMFLTKRPERMREYFSQVSDEKDVQRWINAAYDLIPDLSPCAAGAMEDSGWPLPNVWLGVSVEDQNAADERIPLLLETPAAVRFISAEPLLGEVDLLYGWSGAGEPPLTGNNPREAQCDGPNGPHFIRYGSSRIDWVIVGGESGPGARPMHPEWARSLRDDCVVVGVPFFFKQWGEHAPWEMTNDPQLLERVDLSRVRLGQRLMPDGTYPGDQKLSREEMDDYQRRGVHMPRVGKKAAGDLLDGKQWHQFPEVRNG